MRNLRTLICLVIGLTLIAVQAQEPPVLNELLDRLSENHMGSISDVFTEEELDVLKTHLNQTDPSSSPESSLLRRRGFSTQSVSPVEVVKIDPEDLSSLIGIGPSPLTQFEGAGVNITQTNTTVIVDNSNRIYIRGINNNNYQDTGINVNVAPNESITGLERLSNGQIYAIGTNGVDSSHLYRLNPMNWSTEMIGGNNGLTLPLCLGRDATDKLVVLDGDDDNIYGIDAISGVINFIGSAGYDANFGQGMAYDSDTDMILLTAFNNTTFDSELRSLNPVTGLTTLMGVITPGNIDQFGFVDWTDEDSLGTNNEFFDTFEFYPNPVNDVLNLSAQSSIREISITDISGKQLLNQQIGALQAEVNLAKLPSGLYLLSVTIEDTTLTYRFVKR